MCSVVDLHHNDIRNNLCHYLSAKHTKGMEINEEFEWWQDWRQREYMVRVCLTKDEKKKKKKAKEIMKCVLVLTNINHLSLMDYESN